MKRRFRRRGVRGSRSRERLHAAHGDERVDLRLEPLDAREVRLDELDRADLAGADESRLLDGGEESELDATILRGRTTRDGEGRT